MNDFKAGDLFLDIEVRTGSLVSGLRNAEKLTARSARTSRDAYIQNFGAQKVGKKVGSDLGKGLKAASKGLGVAGKAIGVGITAAEKVFTLTKTALKAAADIDQLSTQVGASAAQFQELRFAAQQFGIEGDQIVGVLDNMNRGVGEFINTGGGEAKKAFDALRLSTSLATGELNGTIPIFDAVVDKLDGVKNAQQRGALAAQIFGEENGTKLNTFLNQGSVGIQKMRDEAKRLGIVLDDIDVKNATEAYGELEKLGTTLRANLNRAIVQAAPQITELTNKLIELAPRLFDWATVAVNGFIALADGIEDLQDIWNASFLGKGTAETLPTTEKGIKDRLKDLDELSDALIKVERSGFGRKAFEIASQGSLTDIFSKSSFEKRKELGINIFGKEIFNQLKSDSGDVTAAIIAQRKQLKARLDGRSRSTESTDSKLLDPTSKSGVDERVRDLKFFLEDFRDQINGVIDEPLDFQQIGLDLFGKESFEQLRNNFTGYEAVIRAEIDRISKLKISPPPATFPDGKIDQSVITRTSNPQEPLDLGDEFRQVMEEVARDIDFVNSLVENSKTPLERYRTELDQLARIKNSDSLSALSGGEETFSRASVQAVEDLANATGDYEQALSELVDLSSNDAISADDFGQGFQNLTNEVETAGLAIKRITDLGASGAISPEAVTAGVDAIKASVDYQKDLNAEKQKEIEQNIALVQTEIAKQEAALELAQLRGDIYSEDGVEVLQRELDILHEQISLLQAGSDLGTARGGAEVVVDNKELAQLQGQLKDTFKGAFRAALDGNFESFLTSKLKNAAANMFDKALDNLLNVLVQNLASFIPGLGPLFAGAFATGGVIGSGKFGLVGENGPELVSAGSGPIRITPLDSGLRGFSTNGLESRGTNQTSPSNVVMNISGVKDLGSFVKSQGTIEADMAAAMRRAQSDF